MTHFGSEILTSDFPNDTGAPDPELQAALATYQSAPGPATMALVVQTLKTARLLIPVVAVVTDRAADGSDKTSEIQQVHFQSDDGRKATLAFTSLAELQIWDPYARPVPQWAALVAASVVELGHDALLLDYGSAHRIAIPVNELGRLRPTT